MDFLWSILLVPLIYIPSVAVVALLVAFIAGRKRSRKVSFRGSCGIPFLDTESVPLALREGAFYMKQNENMPLLPQGITGFWSSSGEPGPGVSAEKFKQLTYAIARNNQMIVSATDSDLTGKNFFWAEYQKYGKSLYLLMNSRYPYLAFTDQMSFFDFHFIDPPENLILPQTDRLILMEKGLLNQPWENQKNTLDETELSQIRFWRPMTIGEIIFNFWD